MINLDVYNIKLGEFSIAYEEAFKVVTFSDNDNHALNEDLLYI